MSLASKIAAVFGTSGGTQLDANLVPAGAPAGAMIAYAGVSAPSGWLFSYGQAVSRTTYYALFAVLTLQLTGNTTSGSASVSSTSVNVTGLGLIGAKVEGTGIPANTTITAATSSSLTLSANATATGTAVSLRVLPFGNGDGSTTFNLPDPRGRAPVGRDDMGGTAASRLTSSGSGIDGTKLGNAGGTETHTLTVAQMPNHNHGVNDPGHSHTLSNAAGAGGNAGTGGSGYGYPTAGTTASVATGITTVAVGSGSAHNNTQPTLVLNHIIKT